MGDETGGVLAGRTVVLTMDDVTASLLLSVLTLCVDRKSIYTERAFKALDDVVAALVTQGVETL